MDSLPSHGNESNNYSQIKVFLKNSDNFFQKSNYYNKSKSAKLQRKTSDVSLQKTDVGKGFSCPDGVL